MRGHFFIFFVMMTLLAGCAKVQVMAPKEPIKVDIAMRLDVYQHVEKDIDNIENMISGATPATKPQSFLDLFTGVAYAQEGLSPQAEEAVMSRKARYETLMSAEAAGRIGENRFGLVELRSEDASLKGLVAAENKDRQVIYQSIAEKNGISLEEVQALYAKKLREGARTGTAIQADTGEWTVK